MIESFTHRYFARIALAGIAVALLPRHSSAQDRLKAMPGYDRYQQMAPQISQVAASVSSRQFNQNGPAISWTPDSKYVFYQAGGGIHTYDVAARKPYDGPLPATNTPAPTPGRGGRGGAMG